MALLLAMCLPLNSENQSAGQLRIAVSSDSAARPAGSSLLSQPAPDPPGSSLREEGGNPRPAATGVDPYLTFTQQPAPVGEADFGLGPGGAPLGYATSIFLGQIDLTNLSVLNSSLPSPGALTFQLNVNLEFSEGPKTYVYWAQDLFQFNTQGGEAQFADAVWNASGVGDQLTPSSLVGNGNLTSSPAGKFYSYAAGPNATGNGIFFPLPAEVQLQVTSLDVQGVPGLDFQFEDGFGWNTYDVVRFPFAAGALVSGFVVNGSAYRPDGKYLDAELVLGGPSPGASTVARTLGARLALLYWNGHNLQSILDSYNFGGDSTASIGHVESSPAFDPTDGSVTAGLNASASGPLGPLFNRSDLGVVNISTSVAAGSVAINAAVNETFQGGGANFTVPPGNYTFAIYADGLRQGAARAAVNAGSYLGLAIAWHVVYSLTFLSAGLPTGVTWSVTVNGSTESSDTSTISFVASTGNYSFQVGPQSGFVASPASGSIPVTTEAVIEDLDWTLQLVALSFVEVGLPIATPWSVTVQGVVYSGTSSAISVTVPPGTVAYSVGDVPGYRSTPRVGLLQVNADNLTVNLTWVPFTYLVNFVANGLPASAIWSVNLSTGGDGTTLTGDTPVQSTELPNGSFAFRVVGPAGYTPTLPGSSLVVAGRDIEVAIPFELVVGFILGNLLPTDVSVWVDNLSLNVSNGSFNFSVVPGIHDVRASAPGYASIERLVIVEANRTTIVDWQLSSDEAGSTFLSPTVGAILGLVGAAAMVGWFAFRRRRSKRSHARIRGTNDDV
ncbi:MAG: thermopsin family protease [Thermoplasmata archaeon]|nr:thermopsin family protease [Thermoplasmata archaeon]